MYIFFSRYRWQMHILNFFPEILHGHKEQKVPHSRPQDAVKDWRNRRKLAVELAVDGAVEEAVVHSGTHLRHLLHLHPVPLNLLEAHANFASIIGTRECAVCNEDVTIANLHVLWPCGHGCMCTVCVLNWENEGGDDAVPLWLTGRKWQAT